MLGSKGILPPTDAYELLRCEAAPAILQTSDTSLDAKYLICDLACLCLYLYRISDAASDQCLADRRLIGNLTLKAVCLRGADNFELHLLIVLYVVYLYGTANVDLIYIYLILYDDFYVLKDLFNLLDTGLDVTLLILRCIILCVLGKVALLARLFDLASDFFSSVYL